MLKLVKLSNRKFPKHYTIPGAKRKLRQVLYSVQRMSDKFLPHLWKILFAGAIAVILIIVCTDWRIGNYENAEEYNSLWIAIAVGILASCIFYWINDVIPRRELHKTVKVLIDKELSEIWEHLRVCTQMVIPVPAFRIIMDKPKTVPKRKEFLRLFCKYDFYSIRPSGIMPVDKFEENQKGVKDKCLHLLNAYPQFLTIAQIRYIRRILTSPFGLCPLEPMDFSIDEEYLESQPNNQKEIGESLYTLYKLRLP